MDQSKLNFNIQDKISELELNKEMANDMIGLALNNIIDDHYYDMKFIRNFLINDEKRLSRKNAVTLKDIRDRYSRLIGNESKIYELDQLITLYDAFNILENLKESEFFSVKYKIGGFASGSNPDDATLEDVLNHLNMKDEVFNGLYLFIRLPNMTYTMKLIYSVRDDRLFVSNNVKDRSLSFVEPYNQDKVNLNYKNIISSSDCHLLKNMMIKFRDMSENL